MDRSEIKMETVIRRCDADERMKEPKEWMCILLPYYYAEFVCKGTHSAEWNL